MVGFVLSVVVSGGFFFFFLVHEFQTLFFFYRDGLRVWHIDTCSSFTLDFSDAVEDPEHSDFLKIRKMLIATHMQDLKEVTHDILYEQFRAQLISSMTPTSGPG